MKHIDLNIVTLGCSKNVVDSEKLIRQLQQGGFNVVFDSDKPADNVIINTCGFINDAKEESIDTILKFALARKSGKIKKLFVIGCLSQRYADELRSEIPEVDEFFGVNDIKKILEQFNLELRENDLFKRTLTGPSHYAFLKISEGCDRHCAFCAIPGIRGRYISEPIENLIQEAQFLHNNGVKELMLIAQDLTLYGIDLYKKPSLYDLIKRLSDLNLFEWIRPHYLYPSNFPFELLDLMRDNPSICKYIDIPIQHITDNMLSMMKRAHNRKETESILFKIREKLPEAAIRTTLIVGHPGETEDDFKALRDFIEEFKFDRLGVFPYSNEEDTWSYNHYEDSIPQEVKEERVAEIMELQEGISAKLNEKRVGTVMKTIIDRVEGEYFVGRSQFDSPEVDQEVLIDLDQNLNVGEFYDIRITDTSEFDLFGVPTL